MTDEMLCHCPMRPHYSLGSMASGSAHEDALLHRWEAEHGTHPYTKARDALANALERAESAVRSASSVLDMVHDVMGVPRNRGDR